MNPVRVGIVGAGGIAKAYADLLPTSTTADCVAVADVNGDAATAMAGALGCPAFASADELAGVDGLEAVVLCTPPVTHGVLAEQFADVGVHVLSEKPLAVNRLAAAEMASIAERGRHRAHDGHEVPLLRRREPRRPHRVVGTHRRGPVWSRTPSPRASTWAGGGTPIRPSPAAVSWSTTAPTPSTSIRYLLGPIAEVLAVETSRPAGLARRRHRAGCTCAPRPAPTPTWTCRGASTSRCRTSCSIYGTLGEIRVGWRESAWRTYGGEWEVIGTGYAKGPAMGGALDAFCRAVRGEAPLAVTVDDGIAAATCIDAAYESLRRGGWVKLAELGLDDLEVPCSMIAAGARIHETAMVEGGVAIGEGTSVWDSVHIRGPGTTIGEDCIIGEKSYVAYGVAIADRVKINAFVYICTGVTIEDGVMISAGTTFTNDRYPRATTPDLSKLRPSDPDEHTLPTIVRAGTTIGARRHDRPRHRARPLLHGRDGRRRHAVGARLPPRGRPPGAHRRRRVPLRRARSCAPSTASCPIPTTSSARCAGCATASPTTGRGAA